MAHIIQGTYLLFISNCPINRTLICPVLAYSTHFMYTLAPFCDLIQSTPFIHALAPYWDLIQSNLVAKTQQTHGMYIGLSGANVDAVKINRVLLSVSDKTGKVQDNMMNVSPFVINLDGF